MKKTPHQQKVAPKDRADFESQFKIQGWKPSHPNDHGRVGCDPEDPEADQWSVDNRHWGLHISCTTLWQARNILTALGAAFSSGAYRGHSNAVEKMKSRTEEFERKRKLTDLGLLQPMENISSTAGDVVDAYPVIMTLVNRLKLGWWAKKLTKPEINQLRDFEYNTKALSKEIRIAEKYIEDIKAALSR